MKLTISTRWAAALAAGTLVTAGLGGAAYAAFNDVPQSSEFAEHIGNVQEAGIATGFPDGTFRPRNTLNRQQAAAWLDRATGRASLDFADQAGEHAPVNPNDPLRTLATIDVTSPADESGSGWVVLQGYVAAATVDPGGQGCPCAFNVRVRDGNGDVVALSLLTSPGPAGDDERPGAGPVGMAPLTGIVPLPGGASDTFTLEIELVDSDVGDVYVAGTLWGQYVPIAEGTPTTESAPGSGPVSLVPGPH